MEANKAMNALSEAEKASLKSWAWALNQSNVNAPPVWFWIVTLLLTPLIVYLFLFLADYPQPNSLLEAGRAWLIYTLASFSGMVAGVALTPPLKRYIYGPDKGNMMPRISIKQERVVKGLFFGLLHVLGAMLSGIIFIGFYFGNWIGSPQEIWTVSWAMTLATLPGLIPGAFTIIAKIKLVTMVRARKRAEAAHAAL